MWALEMENSYNLQTFLLFGQWFVELCELTYVEEVSLEGELVEPTCG